MQLRREEGMQDASLAGVILAMSSCTSPIDMVPHLLNNAKELETDVLCGSRSDFDVAAKRGKYLFQMQADELVTKAYPDLCATFPEILEVASSVLVHDHALDALCKIVNLWFGKVPATAAAGLLRAIIGRLDASNNGTQKARSLVTALLDPFVTAAVQECIRYKSKGSTIVEPTYEFTFELRVRPHSPELSTKDFEQPCHPTSAATTAPIQRADSVHGGVGTSKRSREEDDYDRVCASGQEVVTDDAGRIVSNIDGAATVTTRDHEGGLEPPLKKRRTDGVAQPAPTAYDFLQKPAKTHTGGAKGVKKTAGAYKDQLVFSDLNNIVDKVPLHHVSREQILLYQGPFTYGEQTDTMIGRNITRYVIMSGVHDVAPPHTLTAWGASLVAKYLSSTQMTTRIAKSLDLPKSQEYPFFCAVGRASYHQPFEDLRKQLMMIYAPAISSAVKAIAPIRPSTDSRQRTRALESRRQHLRDVIRLGAKGIKFTLGLTSFEAVMSTDKVVVDAMLSYELFENLGIIEHWRQRASRC
ncbi:hypothetical protein K523DRAFT_307682 [Schizophyllum commune Tattone D]|nr:hypothetical protein K523DRAFT_307682 [Schizophyllum commune Tattone D]